MASGSSLTGPVLIAGAGSLLLYSGINGKGFLSALRGLLHGQAPSTAPAANSIQQVQQVAGAAPAGAAESFNNAANASAGASASQPTIAGSASQTAFATAVLAGVGALPTSANLSSMISWMAHEEPQSDWNHWNNPFNTTQVMPGSTSQNSVGVQSYPSLSEGLAATVITLENGNYNDILSNLRAGRGLQSGAEHGLSTWSGGGYSSV